MTRGEPRDRPPRVSYGAPLCRTVLPLVLLVGARAASASGGSTAGDTWSVSSAEAVQGESAAQEGQAPVEPGTSAPPAANVAALHETRESLAAGDEVLPLDESEMRMDGYVNLRSRSRWADDDDSDDDHDLDAVLGADYVKDGPDGWGLHILLQGTWGVNSQDEDSVFYGVIDTYSNRLDGRVYHAYADAAFVEGLDQARVGRMVIYDTPATAYFDGAQLETTPVGPTRLIVGAYGGQSVHESEAWPSDEWMGGAYTRFRPWENGQLRLDWMHLGDDDRYGDGKDDLISGELRHRLGRDVSLEGNYTMLDGESNDMRLDGSWLWPEQDLTLRATYYRLLEEQKNLAYELNPYYNILNTYYPYDETRLSLSKTFGETLELYGGTDFRQVDHERDIGRYNREYNRYYLTAAFPELLPVDTTVSFTGEIWDSPDNDVDTWGLDLTSEPKEDLELSVGTYYSLYKYYFDVDSERDHVRTYYGAIRHEISESTRVVARYEYEDEEGDSYQTLRLGVTWRF